MNYKEVAYYQHYRTLSGPAAMRTILGDREFLKSYYFSHGIELLPVHLENQDMVQLPGESREDFQRALDHPPRSKLLKFFQVVRQENLAGTKYVDIPTSHRWKNGTWVATERGTRALGVIMPVVRRGANFEKYCLYLLLSNVPGPTSFQSLKEVDGRQFDIFKGACIALGLIHDDEAMVEAVQEIINVGTPAER